MKPQVFADSLVRTPVGRGIVRKFRGVDGMYKCHDGMVVVANASGTDTSHFTEENLLLWGTYTSPPATSSLRAVINFRGEDRVYEIRRYFTVRRKREAARRGFTYKCIVHEQCLQPPPVSPSRSFFSMLGLSSGKNAAAPTSTPAPVSSCVTTIYGKDVVCSCREKAMLLQSGGIFQLLRYGLRLPARDRRICRSYADETGVEHQIDTIFGLAATAMSQPYNGCCKAFLMNSDYDGVVAYVQADHAKEERWKLSTPFGRGTVRLHRVWMTFTWWTCRQCMNAARSASGRPVRGVVGQPVDTIYGSGMLEQNVIRAIKASRGDMVMTPFGSGGDASIVRTTVCLRNPGLGFEWPEPRINLHEDSLLRTGLVEKPPSGCVVM
ncbi:unnamed protein product [Hyaloperonospora brassicae]|uniref:Uncharacterized protein n=1 Tax=Hyaloperonospora brassicae TaxID=162125 RepID=A0AAV0UW68_HYABA|nr:unnamed protein product [Hyaloperonospora brassicae]